MSKQTKRKLSVLAALSMACGLAFLLLATGFRTPPPDREITLIAKEMAFYLEGKGQANPVLTFAPGLRVRLHFLNRDPGMVHDLVLPDFKVSTGAIPYGGEAFLEFNARGPGEYLCSLHPAMMRGVVATAGASPANPIVSTK